MLFVTQYRVSAAGTLRENHPIIRMDLAAAWGDMEYSYRLCAGGSGFFYPQKRQQIEDQEDRVGKGIYRSAPSYGCAAINDVPDQKGIDRSPHNRLVSAFDGRRGDHVLLAPPFITSDTQVDEVVSKLKTAFEAVV